MDKKILGTLDQSNGCLIIYHEQKKDVLYTGAQQVIENLLSTVDKLSEASITLRKQHWNIEIHFFIVKRFVVSVIFYYLFIGWNFSLDKIK